MWTGDGTEQGGPDPDPGSFPGRTLPPIDPAALRAIFDHSIDGILFTVPGGPVLAANPAAEEILAMSADEICRRGSKGLADHSDERWAAADRKRRETGRFRGDLRIVRGDGSVFTAGVTSSVFEDADGNLRACVIFRDVTDRDALVAERTRAAAVEEISAERGRLAHELHDGVIQSLFALGMRLEAVLRQGDRPAVDARIRETIQGLDEVVGRVRATILALRGPGSA